MIDRRPPLLALLALAACSSPSAGGTVFVPPMVDVCLDGKSHGISALQIGSAADPFAPYSDGDDPHTVNGGQGLQMLPIRLRFTGPAVPACVQQSSSVSEDYGNGLLPAGSASTPLVTYAQPDGSRATRPLYIILQSPFNGATGEVTTTVGALLSTIYFRRPRPSDMGAAPSDLVSAAD